MKIYYWQCLSNPEDKNRYLCIFQFYEEYFLFIVFLTERQKSQILQTQNHKKLLSYMERHIMYAL